MLKMNWDMAQIVLKVSKVPWASESQFDETVDMLRADAQAVVERLSAETGTKWTLVVEWPQL